MGSIAVIFYNWNHNSFSAIIEMTTCLHKETRSISWNSFIFIQNKEAKKPVSSLDKFYIKIYNLTCYSLIPTLNQIWLCVWHFSNQFDFYFPSLIVIIIILKQIKNENKIVLQSFTPKPTLNHDIYILQIFLEKIQLGYLE